ncbi:MAG: hypothetical protein JRJ23_11040 [Deltaproteobacteria bacterium]|nr:hypothetical protein [Deltaproteobacteria bacterium]
MKNLILMILITTFCYGSTAFAEDTPTLSQLMEQNRFTVQERSRVQQILADAEENGIPQGPIQEKAYEGFAKKVTEQRIIQAMEAVSNRYQFAYTQANRIGQDPDGVEDIGNNR